MKACSMFAAVLLFMSCALTSVTQLWGQAQSQPEAKNTARLQQDPAPGQSQPSTEIVNAAPAGGARESTIAVPMHNAAGLAQGTTLLAEFSHSLNVKKLKPGDKIKATLDQDLIIGGKVLAKPESKLLGHVTEVKTKDGENGESRLGVVFDKILLKHHQELDFQAVVQALAPPAPRRSRVDEPDQMMPPPMVTGASVNTNGGTRGANTSSNSSRMTNTAGILATTSTGAGQVAVGSTPGSNPGNMSTVHVAMTNNQPMSGGAGMHGVFGLKNLALTTSSDSTTPGPVIVSTKSNVKLETGTQIVLLVR